MMEVKMRAIRAIIVTALLVTSPVSLAVAQTGSACEEACWEQFRERDGACIERWGQSFEGEICRLAVGQEQDGCLYICRESAAVISNDIQVARFRPVEADIYAQRASIRVS